MARIIRLSIATLLSVLTASLAWAQNGSLSPAPWFTGFDNNGLPVSGGKICTYLAGSATPQATYTDVGLLVANSNPIILDPAGRATIFLSATSYKFVFRQPGTTTDCTTGTIIRTQDNIGAVPLAGTGASVLGTAGQALTLAEAVYLSDGSGGKTAGQWFPADSGSTYSNATPIIGFTPNAISSGAIGVITIGGSASGFTSLTVGAAYYVSTAGTVTATPPSNARWVGQADTTTSLIVSANPPTGAYLNAIRSSSALLAGVCEGRLTLTTLTPVTTADVTGAASIFFTPYKGRNIGLYDGTNTWTLLPFTETTLALGTLTSALPYDVFAYNNSGTLALEALAWTNTTTRATPLVLQDGVYSKTGALTRRYLGTFVTSSTTTTEDSFAKRYLWNYYNRVLRPMRVLDATDTWSYNTATYRQANGAATNQLDLVVGVAEVLLHAEVRAQVKDSGAAAGSVSIGQDSTTTGVANVIGMLSSGTSNATGSPVGAAVDLYPAVGRHTYVWLEAGPGGATTTTWYGDNGTPTLIQSGIFGTIQG